MPWPDSWYQPLPFGSIAAAFQSVSSRACVPELAPRLMKVAPLVAMAFSASTAVFADWAPTASEGGPTRMKSLCITSSRSLPKPSVMNCTSAAGEWTRRTSASPLRPIVIAWPEPTAIGFAVQPVRFSKRGRSTSSRPESWVLVVVARMISPLCGTAVGSDVAEGAPSPPQAASRSASAAVSATRYVCVSITPLKEKEPLLLEVAGELPLRVVAESMTEAVVMGNEALGRRRQGGRAAARPAPLAPGGAVGGAHRRGCVGQRASPRDRLQQAHAIVAEDDLAVARLHPDLEPWPQLEPDVFARFCRHRKIRLTPLRTLAASEPLQPKRRRQRRPPGYHPRPHPHGRADHLRRLPEPR